MLWELDAGMLWNLVHWPLGLGTLGYRLLGRGISSFGTWDNGGTGLWDLAPRPLGLDIMEVPAFGTRDTGFYDLALRPFRTWDNGGTGLFGTWDTDF